MLKVGNSFYPCKNNVTVLSLLVIVCCLVQTILLVAISSRTKIVNEFSAVFTITEDKAAEEIYNVFGDKPQEVTSNDLAKLPYLHMVVKEVLRLFSIAPFIIRKATEDTQISDYVIPKGCDVMIPIYYVHRNPLHWEKPEEFYPDHFLPETVAKRHPYAYIPFSGGPRMCLGKYMAMPMLKLLLANLLQHFRFESEGSFADIKFRCDISMRPIDGYKVKIFKRTWDTKINNNVE